MRGMVLWNYCESETMMALKGLKRFSLGLSSRVILFCLVSIVIANGCFAASDDIVIVKSGGDVTTSDVSGKREKAVGSQAVLQPKSVLATGPNGRAVVRMGNAGYIVLEKNSKVELTNTKARSWFLRQITGMIYYAVHKMKGEHSFEVRTTTAVAGVRGTRFLVVDTPKRAEIDMRKGKVSVTSPDGDFEIHKKTEQDDFEAYKQEGKEAIEEENRKFSEYKDNVEKEFVEYKREFSLGANLMASFDGKRVVVRPLSAESGKDMAAIEAYANEWLSEVVD